MKHWTKALVALVFGIAASSPGEADAWFKFKNSTPNTLWTAMAHSHWKSTSFFFICGHSDGCGINDKNPSGDGMNYEYHVRGWWGIAPGGTATVCGWEFDNGVHFFFAEDDFGHFWGNGDRHFCAPSESFSQCGDACPSGSRNLPFSTANPSLIGIVCCGGDCGGNKTINFVL